MVVVVAKSEVLDPRLCRQCQQYHPCRLHGRGGRSIQDSLSRVNNSPMIRDESSPASAGPVSLKYKLSSSIGCGAGLSVIVSVKDSKKVWIVERMATNESLQVNASSRRAISVSWVIAAIEQRDAKRSRRSSSGFGAENFR